MCRRLGKLANRRILEQTFTINQIASSLLYNKWQIHASPNHKSGNYAVSNGWRKTEAIAVSAPEVYHEADTGKEGDVSGGESEELARSLHREIRKAYPSVPEKVIKGAWIGTVCDGAYQTTGFVSNLASILNQEEWGEFFNVLWDAPHFLDLVFSDVFNGKTGDSKDFIKTLVDRFRVVHRLFQRDKMLSHAVEMSKKDDELVLRLTSRACKWM